MQTVWFKNKGGGGGGAAPCAPPLDPPLLKEARIDKLEEECNGLQLSFFLKLVSLIVFQSSFCCL